MSLAYDKKFLIKCLIMLGGTLAVLTVSRGMAFALVGVVLFVMSKGRTEGYLFCMLIACAMMMTNSWFVPKNIVFTLSQRGYIVILGMAMIVQIAGRRSSRFVAPFLVIFAYVVYMLIPSFRGWNPIISFLKLVLFTVIYLAYYGVTNRVSLHSASSQIRVRTVFLAFAIYFLVGSILLIPFPGISMMGLGDFLPNEVPLSLFKGMTFHSQSLGPIVTSIAIVLYADLLFAIRKPDKLYILLLLCCPVLIYKTSSRTAMGAYLIGMAFTTMVFLNAHHIAARWKSKVWGWICIVGVVGLVAVLGIGSVRDRMIKFVMKFDADARSSDISFRNVTSTRQAAMEESLRNFRESPAIGNGFQVTKAYLGFKINRLASAISAPIEKGVWVTAVLEEGGVFGMIIFGGFVIYMLATFYKRKAYIACSAFFTMILINLGEFVVFSLTATGGWIWFCVFVGAAMDALRVRDDSRPGMPPPMMGWRPGPVENIDMWMPGRGKLGYRR